MPDPSSRPLPDPFKVWKQWFDVQENAWSTFCHEFLSSEAFAAAMGQYLEGLTAVQSQFKPPAARRSAEPAGPTRAEWDRLTDEVRSLRRAVADLERRIGRAAGPEPEAAEAPRGTRPARRTPRASRAKEQSDE